MVPEPARAAVDAAVATLAASLGVDPAALTVRSVEPVDWPDSALGCPQPDRVYAQVITPGYRIVLEHAGTAYELHTNRDGRTVVRC